MTESELHKLCTKHLHGVPTRFENLISSGIFDSNWCYNGEEVWVEYKILHGTNINVRGSQRVWGQARLKQSMLNLYFFVANDVSLNLLYAEDVFEACTFDSLDGEGNFVVNIEDMPALYIPFDDLLAWTRLNDALFIG